MKNSVIDAIENKQKKSNIPMFNTGDIIKVQVKIIEGKKERLQAFAGTVIKKCGSGMNATMTVRKVVDGIGVERTFPIHSKVVASIEVTKFSKTRRSRLYYLRDLIGSKVMRLREDLEMNIKAASDKSKLRKEEAKKREADAVVRRAEEAKKKTEEAKQKKEAAPEKKPEEAKEDIPKKEEPKKEDPKEEPKAKVEPPQKENNEKKENPEKKDN